MGGVCVVRSSCEMTVVSAEQDLCKYTTHHQLNQQSSIHCRQIIQHEDEPLCWHSILRSQRAGFSGIGISDVREMRLLMEGRLAATRYGSS